MSGRVRPTSDFTDLVFLVLGHLALDGPARLYDPRMIAWATEHLPAADRAILAEDAPRLAALATDRWQAWPELFDDLEQLEPARARALARLGFDDVAAPWLLTGLAAEGDGAELMHATLSLLAPACAELHRRTLAPIVLGELEAVARWIGELAELVPGLADARVELSGMLGGHGRGFAMRIVVGAPAPWHGGSALDSALWALHEHLVLDAAGDWGSAERQALRVGQQVMEAARPELAEAHRAWLARLDLSGLAIEPTEPT